MLQGLELGFGCGLSGPRGHGCGEGRGRCDGVKEPEKFRTPIFSHLSSR